MNNIILLLVFLIFVALAGLFAGSETGVYRLSRLRLRLGMERKRRSHIILGRSLSDASGLLISLLLGTNLAHYLATSSMTYIMLSYTNSEHRAELLACLVSTPVFFVFSELIPKNIFYYRADHIMPIVSPFVSVFHRIASYTGIIWLMKKLSSLASFLKGDRDISQRIFMATTREHFEAILLDTKEEKILTPVQTDMIWRLRSISRHEIQSVMTPMSKVETLNINSSRANLISQLEKNKYTRYPVYEGDKSNIIGFVNIYDSLSGDEDFITLQEKVQPIRHLDADIPVLEAIHIMQRENQKIILVAQTAWGKIVKPLGIVTMKDLAEELLGELGEW